MLLSSGPGHAQAPCEPPAARVVSIQGTVELRRAGTDVWTPAMLEEGLCIGDALRVGQASRAALALANDSTLRLDQRTTLQLRGVAEEERSLLELLFGAVYFFSHRPRALEIDTPFVNAAAEGTEFLVRVGDDRAEVVMLDGQVLLRNPHGELRVASGDAALVPAGAAPAPMVVVRPRDAVAWALYYPPILAELAGPDARPRPLPPGLQTAVERVADNDYAGALQALETMPEPARDARYHTYRAGVLLNVGRVDEAAAAIERALALDPAAGEALAQRAIIRVVQNRSEDALADARRAVELSPDSSAARIALSYALQSAFQLEEARAVLREAVASSPEDALAWARLAELEQMFGALGASRDAAEQAVALAPGLSRTQMVLGFAALTRIDIDQAKAAFERAIALDSANPLPRLGLGLAKIRRSDLEGGRHEIEIAAALAPNDALIRSYLGKAYFEEKRDPLDAQQFAIAKQLDPNDPTPWFYDAIRLQTENRPVEALRSLERSIELNDNRAVYRSRLLLDEDAAIRGVSLARIYDDLGFDQVALVEATKSLSQDPANHSAHRFLSDTYARLPRHEIARVSELLQSQLLQPININPVQPSFAVTDLNVITGIGPGEAAFNEFTPLFTRNDAQLTATGVIGNNDTYGGESVLTMLYGRTSLSVGGSALATDGFRDNNDDKTKLANIYGQVAVTPKLNLQAEYRYRDTDQGDLRLNFDPDDFSRDNRRNVDRNLGRVGLHYAFEPHSDFVVSAAYADLEETQQLEFVGPTSGDDEGYQVEGQYLFHGEPISVIGGVGALNVDSHTKIESFGVDDTVSNQQYNGYVYTNTTWPASIIWTIGAALDSYEREPINRDQVSPKIGVQWDIKSWLRLRGAYFQTLKRPLVLDQTIEPTQVAGFNQFFDDINGTRTTGYGIGLDTRLASNVYAGVEFSKRELEVPFVGGNNVRSEDQDEDLYRGYVYWAPHRDWALSLEYRFEKLRRESAPVTDRVIEIETHSVPATVRYFSPLGVFAEIGATFVAQKIKPSQLSTFDQDSDEFVLVDAAVGYRLAKRRGILSLEARNLLDEDFLYQQENIQSSEPTNPRFIPNRTVLLRATLNF